MSDLRLKCPACGERVSGEHSQFHCEWHAPEDCDCGPVRSGEWYIDGEEYECGLLGEPGCGRRLVARVDEPGGRVTLKEPR